MTFEDQVGELLWKKFPYAVLSNVPIYRPDSSEDRPGYEIDHLLHAGSSLSDRLLVVECKGPPVFGRHRDQLPHEGGPWNVEYPHQQHPGQMIRKDCKRQVENHARALMGYLRGVARELQIEAWVVSRDHVGPDLDVQEGRIRYRLIAWQRFEQELRRFAEAERIVPVRQSPLLGALRRGFPVPEIGHPELGNALAYAARCRNAIDVELFSSFKPVKGWWAVNGSAGMGKSVLLAYGLFVFASDKQVVPNPDGADGPWRLESFDERAAEIGLPDLADRSIFAMARKEKQVRGLEELWTRFVAEYSKLESSLNVRFNRPVFRRWDGEIPAECNVLVIDEAHDIPPEHHDRIAQWIHAGDVPRYLAIACDRHQLLRLVGADAPLIQGINFRAPHTTRLKRNYRNPFAVYAGSLALMFRWFAPTGPKILPKREELKDEFGFDVRQYGVERDQTVELASWNDSHPGNYWSFTVSSFASCAEVFSQLASEGFGKNEVLWVRFSPEDESFDYEKLARFTYHNCFNDESSELVDKYVKGQEFPVVVVEGFPRELETSQWQEGSETEAEKQMWKARRELYLCCSRSTCFLHFIHADSDEESKRGPAAEIAELVRQLSHPENRYAVTRRTWQFSFRSTGIVRSVPVFTNEDKRDATPPPDLKTVVIGRPVTGKVLATALGLQVSVLIDPLLELGFTLRNVLKDIIPDTTAKELALKYGVILQIADGESPSEPSDGNRPSGGSPVTLVSNTPSSGDRGIVRTEPPIAVPPPLVPANQFESSLIQFSKSWEFRHHSAKVDRYRALLTWMLNNKPETREVLLRYERGRHRKYFATTADEIYKSAGSPNPQTLGVTGIWALTTSPTEMKVQILNDVMHQIGVSLPTRQEVLREF
jgi:hypothetical protein